MKITLGVILVGLSAVYAQDPMCCHSVSDFTSCQQACDNMALESTSLGRRQHLPSLRSLCPLNLNDFWGCVNNSAPDIWEEDTGWMGRMCCYNALSRRCELACSRAKSFAEVEVGCTPGDEVDLFDCLTRFQKKEQCCGQAPTGNPCRKKCEKLFEATLPTEHMKTDANTRCSTAGYREVAQCLSNYTNGVLSSVNPKDSLHCCDRASTEHCQDICRQVHSNLTSEDDIMTALVEGCGNPNPSDDMWKCFLLDPVSRPTSQIYPPPGSNRILSIDSARLQCCARAVSPKCRDICIKLYSTSWSSRDSWNQFDEHCQYQPVEASLLICLADVQEPCQPGCSGLDYCAKFNNRPTELFRSCSARSDESARSDMDRWGNGVIQMPFMHIPVLNIAECESDRWKAVACTLQVKPCHAKSHTNMICRSDCVHILNQCIDKPRLPKGLTPEGLCNILSPREKSAPCVSLDEYLQPAKYPKDQVMGVTYPCITHSCANHSQSNAVCSINREACTMGEVCKQHKCEDGCKLGEASTFLVSVGSWIRLTDPNNEGCYQACQCGRRGELRQCQTLRCDRRAMDSCRVSGQIREHGSHYHIDCNICTCYEGTEICSSRQCLTDEMLPEERHRYNGLPCDCSDQYVPMCADNGKTYPSACLAKCAEKFSDSQVTYGDCSMKHPCQSSNNVCPSGTRCVPKRAICISVNFGDCPQYECVSVPKSCDRELYEPVCDTEGTQHPNLCTLNKRQKVLAYRGECVPQCHDDDVQVCGHNGETYPSKCAAWHDRTTVDYFGPCQAVGSILGDDTQPQCTSVTCPELPSASNCVGVPPPGGCCPVCAGQVRILFSKTEADRVAIVMGSHALLLSDILDLLRKHIVVAECDLYGFLSIEGDIVVLVSPIMEKPTTVQIEVCNTEAEKLEALINSRSPILISYLQLTPLLAATTQKVEAIDNSGLSIARPSFILHVSVLLICLCLQKLLKDRSHHIRYCFITPETDDQTPKNTHSGLDVIS